MEEGTAREQQLHDLQVALHARVVQRREAAPVEQVDQVLAIGRTQDLFARVQAPVAARTAPHTIINHHEQ